MFAGTMIPPYWPYGDSPGTGFWGKPESNVNFCEEDYIITQYIGEFINTLTNLTYVIYGAHGIRRIRTRKDGGLFSTLSIPYWGLIGVGFLSGWFHATLKYHSQMGDDLSMFLASGSLLHQLQTFDAPPRQRLINTTLILGAIIPVSVYHVWADEVAAHEILFGIIVFLIGLKIRALIKEKVKGVEAKNRLSKLANIGMSSGALGYFLWNIDYHFCSYVTAFKRSLGLPWGFIFELHGWWHIFTGIGAYVGMALVEYLVTIEEGETGKVQEGFVWPARSLLRDIEGEKQT